MKLIESRSAWARLLLLAPLAASPMVAQEAEKGPRAAIAEYNLEKGVALEGHDPVAYFPEGGGKPVEGKANLTATHRGVTYRFANEKNRSRFQADPTAFEPAYGGWCAYAMADGKQVEVDPESFLVEDGRLLVFYDGFLNDTRKKWLKKGASALRPQADANWKKISGETAGEPSRDVSQFNLKSGLALGGYDPASYRLKTPKPGNKAIEADFQGVRYRFATEASKNSFLSEPGAFEPRYGGWCAWAMSQGKKVEVDPNAFVRDGEGLFLFYNTDKRDEWVAARKTMVKDADGHWAKLTGNEM